MKLNTATIFHIIYYVLLLSLFLLLPVQGFFQKIYADTPTPIPQPLTDPVDAGMLDRLNPLIFLNANSELHNDGSFSVAGVINRLLNFIFPLAGLILFVMIVWGGFEMMTGAASKKNLDAGKQRVTAAIVGFLLLFVSYWIIQIIEYVTKVSILG